MPNISIIIRTKNEEKWISHCLKMIFLQDYKDFEVILVDNNSSDGTIEAAKKFKINKIIKIDKFLPGKALNDGIKVSEGNYVVCLSAHCIPKHKNWLSKLLYNFKDKNVAGVYGRQLPISFTDEVDKRDLVTVFGEDRRVQVKDYFFHNANSMLRKDLWNKFPFDEKVTNIEDRVWGKQIVSAGYQIIYDPDASVYHYHGLNHGNSSSRAKGVVSIIEQIDFDILNDLPDSMRPENLNIVCLLLIKDELNKGSKEYSLFLKTVDQLKASKYLKNIYIVSNNNSLSESFKLDWINRDLLPYNNDVGVDDLLKMALESLERNDCLPDAIVYVNHDYVNRPNDFIDHLIYEAQFKGYDTVFAGFKDYGHYWTESDGGGFIQIAESMKSKSDRNPLYKALYGLGCFMTRGVLKKGSIVGGKVGILPVDDFSLTLRSKDTKQII